MASSNHINRRRGYPEHMPWLDQALQPESFDILARTQNAPSAGSDSSTPVDRIKRRRRFPPAAQNEYFPRRNRSESPGRPAAGRIPRLVAPNGLAPMRLM